MIDEKNCKIVQDLLPNYIEKLNNKETVLFVMEIYKKIRNKK